MMKAVPFLALLVLSLLPLTAFAEKVGTIETLHGKRYRECHIVRVHPDGVSFRHEVGAAKILFTDLPEKWRKKFGYSPAKAEAYQKELVRVRAEEQARLDRRYAEMAEAQRQAHEMRLARLRASERQVAAYAPMSLVPGGPVPFIGSPLGNTSFAYGPQSQITGPAFGGTKWRNSGGYYYYGNGFVSLGSGSGGTLTVGSFSPAPRFRGYPNYWHASPTLGYYQPGVFGGCYSRGRPLPFTGLGAVPGIGPNVIISPPAISVRSGGISLSVGR